MDTDLVFLAASSQWVENSHVDKYLDGYATLQFTPDGGLRACYDEECHDLVDGPWFFPAHPGVRTRFMGHPAYGGWHHRHMGFRGSLVEEWRAAGLWPEAPQKAPDALSSAEWDTLFGQCMALSRRTGRWGRLRAINMLEGLLLQLADARAGEPAAPGREPWLNGVIHRLAVDPQRANEPPDYAAIAAGLGMSTSTLQRRFKKAMNTTLHAYTLRSRIDAARTLLAETDLPIKVVAGRLGYDNVYFFSRQFRQVAGVSPGVFRRSQLHLSARDTAVSE